LGRPLGCQEGSAGREKRSTNRKIIPGYNPPISNRPPRKPIQDRLKIAHSLRDGTFWKEAAAPAQLTEKYELIIVGGGISGLAAAHFLTASGAQAKREDSYFGKS